MKPQPSYDEFDEVERYELREPQPYAFRTGRREFVQTLGVGFMVAVASGPGRAQRRGRTARREEPLGERFHFGADGVVTVMTSKVEVGQGSRTQISQAVAEEFGLPVERNSADHGRYRPVPKRWWHGWQPHNAIDRATCPQRGSGRTQLADTTGLPAVERSRCQIFWRSVSSTRWRVDIFDGTSKNESGGRRLAVSASAGWQPGYARRGLESNRYKYEEG